MPYLIAHLWKLPTLAHDTDPQLADSSDSQAQHLLAAACRDCGNYNFPRKSFCRYCGSPRVRTVSVPGNVQPNPGTWLFGTAKAPKKPN
jgi:hypothetical protein